MPFFREGPEGLVRVRCRIERFDGGRAVEGAVRVLHVQSNDDPSEAFSLELIVPGLDPPYFDIHAAAVAHAFLLAAVSLRLERPLFLLGVCFNCPFCLISYISPFY